MLCINNVNKEQFMVIKTEEEAVNMMRSIFYSRPLTPHPLTPSVLVLSVYDIDNNYLIPSNSKVTYWYWQQFKRYEYRIEYDTYYPKWKTYYKELVAKCKNKDNKTTDSNEIIDTEWY